MPKCLFDRSSGKFIKGYAFDDIPHDHSTHIQIDLPDWPSESDRWDGNGGIRPATQQESNADLDAEKERKVQTIFDVAPAFRALVDVLYPLLPDPKPTKSEIGQAIRTRIKELL